MASVATVIRNSQINRKGLTPVYVRLTHNGRSKFLATKVYVNPTTEWDEKRQRVKSKFKNSARTNLFIADLESKVQKLAIKLDSGEVRWNNVDLKALMYETKEDGFIKFGREMAQRFLDDDSFRTYKRYNTILNKLQAYIKTRDLSFDELDVAFLTKYENYLIKLGNGKNTVHTNLKTVRAIFYEAIRHKKVEQAKNPFFQFKLKKEKPDISKPTIEEIEKIRSLDFTEKQVSLKNTRDAFLFSLYCAGIRVGDLLQLTPENILANNVLSYKMDKTAENRLIKLTKPALEILGQYQLVSGKPIFPFLSSDILKGDRVNCLKKIESITAGLNVNLKKVVALAGIERNYTMHMSRHGFTEIARKKNVDIYGISKALGHSSLAITEQYLKSFDLETQEAALEQAFGAN